MFIDTDFIYLFFNFILILFFFKLIYLFLFIYFINFFQAVHCAIIFYMFLHVSKYPPTVIFPNANIKVQHADVTGSLNWYDNVELVFACTTQRFLV